MRAMGDAHRVTTPRLDAASSPITCIGTIRQKVERNRRVRSGFLDGPLPVCPRRKLLPSVTGARRNITPRAMDAITGNLAAIDIAY